MITAAQAERFLAGDWCDFNAELLTEITVQEVGRYLVDDNYGLQEKFNGHRRILIKQNEKAFCLNRTGTPRSLPSPITTSLSKAKPFENDEGFTISDYVLDGELLTGGIFVAFDVLAVNGVILLDQPLSFRLECLAQFKDLSPLIRIAETAFTNEEKLALLERLDSECAEGAVVKKLSATYLQGRAGQHFKLKFWKTLSAIVIGRSEEKGTGRIKDGVDVGLFGCQVRHCDSCTQTIFGRLHRISGCSLIGREQVREGDVIEVRYLYGSKTNHIVQPVMLMKRDDIPQQDCNLSQIVMNKNWRGKWN